MSQNSVRTAMFALGCVPVRLGVAALVAGSVPRRRPERWLRRSGTRPPDNHGWLSACVFDSQQRSMTAGAWVVDRTARGPFSPGGWGDRTPHPLIVAFGFTVVHVFNLRPSGAEDVRSFAAKGRTRPTFGEPIWWDDLRLVHAITHVAAALALWHGHPQPTARWQPPRRVPGRGRRAAVGRRGRHRRLGRTPMPRAKKRQNMVAAGCSRRRQADCTEPCRSVVQAQRRVCRVDTPCLDLDESACGERVDASVRRGADRPVAPRSAVGATGAARGAPPSAAICCPRGARSVRASPRS